MFDPPQYQGIAHFLEHMLFLGTTKYPEEDSYNKYLAQNGGRSNAFTSDTNTVYFFTFEPDIGFQQAGSLCLRFNRKLKLLEKIRLVDLKTSESLLLAEIPVYFTVLLVNSGALDGALDRFSYFFKEPLFTQSATDREVQAVNSENSKNLQADVWRMMQLERELVFNKEHPSYHFGTGNKDTLAKIPRDALLNFHNKWYSANIMKLAVIGTESLDELQDSVMEKFSEVVNKDVHIPVDSEFGDASFLKNIDRPLPNDVNHIIHVSDSARGLVSFVVPIREIRQVDFAFFMPTQSPLWETKPSRYLSHIFGHEGEGSLLSYLKSQGLATGLSAGAVYDTAGLSVFKISISIPNSAFELAAKPMDVIQRISEAVAQYTAVCRSLAAEEGPNGYPPLWKEMRMVEEMQFRPPPPNPTEAVAAVGALKFPLACVAHRCGQFQSMLEPMSAVQQGSISMHQPYPIKMVFSGGVLDEHWDRKQVQEHLDMINSENMFLRIVGKEFEGFCDQHEKWYGTTYGLASNDVKRSIFENWKATEGDISKAVEKATQDGMALPRRNPFIAERLDVKLKEEYPKDYWPAPKVLSDCGSNVRVFFKQDGRFHIPKTNVMLNLFAPYALDSQRRALQVAAAAMCRSEELNEMAYDAECAGLVYRLVGDSEGLRISVSGYDDKLELLLNKVCHKLRDDKPIDEAAFERRPYHRLTTSLDIASDFTTDDVNGVIREVLSEGVVIEGLIEGNTRADEAKGIVKEATDMFTVAGDGKEPITRRAVADLSKVDGESAMLVDGHKDFVITRPGANKDEKNGAVVMTLHLGWQKSPGAKTEQEDADDILLSCRANVLSQILSQKFFDSLRTKQQLGYIVHSSLRIVEREVGMLFLVQSEVSVLDVQKRIEEFIDDIPNMLSSLTDEEYRDYIKAVVENLKETPKKQADEFNRHVVEISARRFDFERRPRLIKLIETNPEITQKDKMVDYARSAFANGERVWARVTGSAESLPDELSDEVIDSLREKHSWVESNTHF
ncbi:hypothetical protein FOL47_003405 [Perkinsus chesapeaki]|uniref:Insulin-degrading enzyme n=1 Tax=Perkinsus chesapeaki TaxID=330153 RepID=A0A7J6M8H6_PERCH|nr:hypothetical protein FOL47_003405 [Perkinsus chesapeaki]